MSLSIKDPAEEIYVTFDFSTQYLVVDTPEVTVSAENKLDDIPEMKEGVPVIVDDNKVIQRIVGGVSGKKYDLRCKVNTETTEIVVAKDVLIVKNL